MAVLTYSVQHKQIYLDDSLGALTERPEARSITVNFTYDDRDGTSFKAGGNLIAEQHGRGALTVTVEAEFNYTRELAKHLRQIAGSAAGFTVRTLSGSNAIPTTGDEVFEAEMTFYSVPLNVQPGSEMRLRITFVLADGAPAPLYERY